MRIKIVINNQFNLFIHSIYLRQTTVLIWFTSNLNLHGYLDICNLKQLSTTELLFRVSQWTSLSVQFTDNNNHLFSLSLLKNHTHRLKRNKPRDVYYNETNIRVTVAEGTQTNNIYYL